ncbi:MAG: glycosyltransferase family 39 protein [Dysgonamonadaceae bacterium]|jgi:hypothetical protein|nr:glycosyltransferase family 39 protein [Dysgonamonadaceae bacterium]
MKNQRYTNGLFALNWQKCFILFLTLWLIINFIQAIFTEVMSDEAYYFLYGENLAWGYFDHPPMVGLMTYVSNLLFDGNLSVRFVTIVLQVFTILLVWKTIADKKPDTSKVVLFFIITASLVMFQVYGFVTTPDAPLLFFAALFLWSYQKFLHKNSWANTFLLTISMAGMIYSKYQSVLIIGFVLLSNWRLLLQYKTWLAALFTVLLLIPHFHWHWVNDFPSFQYHLSDRSSTFKWGYFLEYLPNQLAVFNPFTFGAVIYVLIRYRPKDVFERGLYFLIVGFLVFFWITSFRGHVEPHWTIACSIPMIILLYRRSLENPKLMRYVKKGIAVSILLILVARILLPIGFLPEKLGFNGKAAKSKAIESVAGDLPVVFTGSFQNPSNYRFFTGKESFVLSAIDSRRTQFDIWQKELAYQGKPVFVAIQDDERSSEYIIDGKSFFGFFAENFQSVNRLQIEYELIEQEVRAGDRLVLPFTIQNPTNSAIDFEHPEFPVTWNAAYSKNVRRAPWNYVECQLNFPIPVLPARTSASFRGNLTTTVPDFEEGEYLFTITLVNSLCAARNSSFILLKITQ